MYSLYSPRHLGILALLTVFRYNQTDCFLHRHRRPDRISTFSRNPYTLVYQSTKKSTCWSNRQPGSHKWSYADKAKQWVYNGKTEYISFGWRSSDRDRFGIYTKEVSKRSTQRRGKNTSVDQVGHTLINWSKDWVSKASCEFIDCNLGCLVVYLLPKS